MIEWADSRDYGGSTLAVDISYSNRWIHISYSNWWTCHPKSGPGKKWTPGPILAEKMDGGGGVHFFLPKVDLVQFCQEKSRPGPVSLSKSKQVHFWQGKKVDPIQFRCQNPGRSIFGRGKKWTRCHVNLGTP